jgi:hypothetical protein
VVRTDGVASVEGVLRAVIPRAFVKAEEAQASDGGSNPRFGAIFDEAAAPEAGPSPSPVTSCAVVSDRPVLGAAVTAALEARSIVCHRVEVAPGFEDAAAALRSVVDRTAPLDAVVVALAGHSPTASPRAGWEHVLADHRGMVERLHADAAWTRAAADYAAGADRPVRLVVLTDATTPSGRSRAQASVQLARVAAGATKGRVTAYGVGIEAPEEIAGPSAGALVPQLLCNPDAAALAGAELAVSGGWIGLRSHPRVVGCITYGGPAVPSWLDVALRDMVPATGAVPDGEAR